MAEEIKKKPEYTLMKDLHGYLTAEDVDKILRYVRIKECKCLERNWLFILMLFRTGRRVSELLKLNVKDINVMQQAVIWNILKKRSALRKLKSIDSETFGYLLAYIEVNEELITKNDGYVFPFKRDWARKLVETYCRESGYNLIGEKKPHPHHFRHSFAINYLTNVKRNEAISLLQQELEHTDIKVTGQYLQFNLEDERKIKEELFVKKKKVESNA